MGILGSCAGCAAKDELIAELKEMLRETNKTALAAVDARAFAIRYPHERKPAPAAAQQQGNPRTMLNQEDPRALAAAARGETDASVIPHWSPGHGQSFDEIEEAFRLQRKAEGADELDEQAVSAGLDTTALLLVEALQKNARG